MNLYGNNTGRSVWKLTNVINLNWIAKRLVIKDKNTFIKRAQEEWKEDLGYDPKGHGDFYVYTDLLYDSRSHGELYGPLDLVYDPKTSYCFPKCFEILSWNCECDFHLINFRSSFSVINFQHFLQELCPFWYTRNTQFSTLFSYMYWHIELKFCIIDLVWMYYTSSLGVNIKFVSRHFAVFWVMNLQIESTVLSIFLWVEMIEKYYKNIALWNFHDGRIMHRLRCFGMLTFQIVIWPLSEQFLIIM